MRKQNTEQERKIQHIGHSYFWTNNPWKNPMWENRCKSSEGLLLLSISKFWIQHWIPHKVIQLQREILAKALSVYLTQSLRNVPVVPTARWDALGRDCASSMLPLCCPSANPFWHCVTQLGNRSVAQIHCSQSFGLTLPAAETDPLLWFSTFSLPLRHFCVALLALR